MIVDFRMNCTTHTLLNIDSSAVETVKSIKFLGVQIIQDLTWTQNTTTTKKAQQGLHFLLKLKKASLPPPILNRGTIESILSNCITVWFENCSIADQQSLQRIVRTA